MAACNGRVISFLLKNVKKPVQGHVLLVNLVQAPEFTNKMNVKEEKKNFSYIYNERKLENK